MLFLRIISWKGASGFNGGVCFSGGGASFLSGECPMGGVFVLMGDGPPPPPTMGNPGVGHAGLLHKGISGQVFGLISSFLSNRQL